MIGRKTADTGSSQTSRPVPRSTPAHGEYGARSENLTGVTDYQDNPAGRLLRFLEALRPFGNNIQTAGAVRAVLGFTEDAPMSELLPYLAKILKWPDEAAELIGRLEVDDRELYLTWHANVTESLRYIVSLDGRLDQVLPRFNDADLAHLRFASSLLHSRAPEPTFDADKIAGLIELIEKIIEEVATDRDLPPSFRQSLLAQLLDIVSALQHYNVGGFCGVEAAMDRFTGYYARYQEQHTPERNSWVKRMWSGFVLALNQIGQVADSSSSVVRAIEAGSNLLDGGGT